MKLILQKNAKFSSAGGGAPRPLCLQRLGVSPPDPHWPLAAGGFALRPPKQPPHSKFLATRLFVHQTLSNCDLNELNPLPLCNVGLIQAQFHKSKRKCAPGLDNICTEHLIYSHPLIYVHITVVCCLMCA